MKFRRLKIVQLVFGLTIIAGCTTGRLEYLTPAGKLKTACETEYTWQPSVDKYAVEYILAYCAKKAVEQGNIVIDKRLLSLDLTIPDAPQNKNWTTTLAKEKFESGNLTDKEYGYIIAFLDLQQGVKAKNKKD